MSFRVIEWNMAPSKKETTRFWERVAVLSKGKVKPMHGRAWEQAEDALWIVLAVLQGSTPQRLSSKPILLNSLSHHLGRASRLLKQLARTSRGVRSTASRSSSARTGRMRSG